MTSHDRLLSAGPGCRIPGSEISWRFGPTGGPGGQHANRAHTRAEATLDLSTARGIDDEVRSRLITRLGTEIKVTVDKHRSQVRNRERALDLLQIRLQEALVTQKRRRPTRPVEGPPSGVSKPKKNKVNAKQIVAPRGINDIAHGASAHFVAAATRRPHTINAGESLMTPKSTFVSTRSLGYQPPRSALSMR